ncbi:ATP-grasp domain-containing protein [Alteribacter natronophilus]|uniref:ATP-grasp domain-containing protein n=1 Tax=Alteribacter natronophilus TaxID=2583810 RepID=UPI00110E7104|nr:ATP-grasp domain-containing protein [Alteribacter natronophilus]TMW72353.1 ATP-grasp domain-containing protein [Alteribacter natronophilus]
MAATTYKWLPHLEGAVPTAGQGKRISTYTVALEGWRRGIATKFYSEFDEENKLKVRYCLSYGGREHHFELSKGDKVTKEAFHICDDKDLTKKVLAKAGVPVPRGEKFGGNVSDEEILRYAAELGFPLVLKPVSANGGKGVFANVRDMQVLKEALPYVRSELGYKEVIIETHVPGDKEYRIIVLEDRVLGAMHRIPANVVGDGVHTIRELIYQKNDFRKKNPHLTSRLIKIDKEVLYMIKEAGYQLDEVLEQDKRLFLRVQSNLSNGGDSVDVTHKLTPEMRHIAIEATKAVPGLAHSGVDLIIDEEERSGVVIEVNSRPGLGGHLFPMEGKARDFAKEFIDFYFPETVENDRSSLYFNFDSILEPIKSRSATTVELPVPPLGTLKGRRFVISGTIEMNGFKKFVKRQALQNNLQGYVKAGGGAEDDEAVIVVVGENYADIQNFKDECLEELKDSQGISIEESEWKKPVKMGFEALSKGKSKSKKDLEKEVNQLVRDKERLEKELNKMKQSNSWKITSPVRLILDAVKKIVRLKR